MQTILSRLTGNGFRKALASVAFAAAVLVAPALSAQTLTAQGDVPSITKAADEFQAFVHPVENSLSMKVHFVNPKEDHVTISIYDDNNQLAYKKTIGKDAIYHGTFDLSKLSDGEYHVTISSRRGTYTRTLSIETQQKRFALAQ
jgi:flagellar hook assembly protein FlgD